VEVRNCKGEIGMGKFVVEDWDRTSALVDVRKSHSKPTGIWLTVAATLDPIKL
jgi:hypothetical protein